MRASFASWVRARVPTLLMALGLLACSGIITGPDDDADTRPRSMRVTPPRMDLRLGDTARVSAILFAVTGVETTPELGRSVTYVSDDAGVATVDASGLVTAAGAGTTRVRAMYGALSLGIQVAVTARPRIDAISGDAQSAEQGDALTDDLVVRAFDGMQAPLAGATLDVAVMSGGGSAAPQAITDENGFARVQWRLGTTLGTQGLKITTPGSDSAMFTATATPGTRPMRVQLVLGRLLLTGAGDTTQMSARAFNVVDSLLPAATFAWRSSADSVAIVSATGLVTSVAPGTAFIVASSGVASDSTSLTVQPPPPPPPPPRTPQLEIVSGDAQAAEQGDALADSLAVRLLDSTSTPVAGAAVAFTVTAGGGSVSAAGVTDASGRVAVQWTLGLPLGAQAVTASVTIQGAALSVSFAATATPGTRAARVAVTPGRPLLTGTGDTTQVSARAFNVADALLPGATFTWRSSASAVATASATGLATSVAPGTAFIVATSGAASDSTSITVQADTTTPPPPPDTTIALIEFDVRTRELLVGDTVTILVDALDSLGVVVPGVTFTWSGGDPAIATIDPATRLVTAIGPGSVQFTATARGVSATIDFTVEGPPPIGKLDLGPDIEQPAGLQSQRTFSIPQARVDPFNVTIRTLDATGAVVSPRESVAGAATATVEMEGGTNEASYWLQAIEGTADRTVTLIAEAPGYSPDTMVVTLVRPAFRLSGAGSAGVPVPATGGDDPIIVVSVGYTFGDGGYEPMAVRIGGTPPSFTLTSTTPTLALVRFVAGAGVVGEDQGPQAAVTFGIAPGTNSVSNGQFAPANLLLARTGATGMAIVTIAGPAEYEALIPGLSYNLVEVPQPSIGLNPEGLRFNYMQGDPLPDPVTVEATNTGTGSLTGLSATVTAYCVGLATPCVTSPDARDWLVVALGSTSAPAVATIELAAQTPPPGTYYAILTFASTVQGVFPVNLVVTLQVDAAPPPTPSLALALVNTPLVGVSGNALVRVTLSAAAPAGGVDVTLVSGNTGVATVNAPATVTVAQGATTADFTVTGVSTGTVQLTASAAGYGDGTLGVTVSTNTISVPLTLNVPYTRTASLPITLTLPAPAGGVLITISSGNPGIVGVVTGSVMIPEGTFAGNAQLEGVALGQVAVTATGPNLATGTSLVRVTAALDLVETGLNINAGFSSASLTTRLLSAGSVFPAPAGGVPLTWVSRNPDCIAAPASLSVPAGLNSVTTTADYGGVAATPCTTYLVVTSPSFDPDSVSITVQPPPTTSLSLTPNLAAGLSRQATIFLNAPSPAGGTEITLTSSDPSRLVLAPNLTTVGAASITLNAPPGTSGIGFAFAAIEGQVGTAEISATVQRYASPTPATITVEPLGVENQVFTPSLNALSEGFGIVFLGALGPAGPSQSVSGETGIRAGGQPVTVTVTSTTPEVALPLVGGVAAASRTLTINPGESRANYAIRPVSAGTTTFTATSASAAPPERANYPTTITVTTPGTSFSGTPTIGAGLSRQMTLFTGAPAPAGGTVITLTSSDPTMLVLAPNATTVGTGSIDLTVPAGSSGVSFTYAGVEGQSGTAEITGVVQGAPPPYSNPAPFAVTVAPIGIESQLFTPTLTLLGGDGFGLVFVGELSAPGPNQAVQGETQIRAGGPTISITLTSTNDAVVLPVVAGVAASPATLTIGPGESRASFGIRPLSGGTSTFTATSPDAGSPVRANYPATVTVNQPVSSFSVVNTIGAGLTRNGTLFLQAPAPAGGVVVTLASSDPSRLLVSPDMTTVGAASVDITIPAGASGLTFAYAAIEGQSGDTPVQITATFPGAQYVAPAPAPVTIDPLGLMTFNFTPTLTTLAGDGAGTVVIGGLTPPGPSQTVNNETPIRAGGQTLTITLTSTTPTVAVPVANGVAGSPATLTIGPGESRANYGIRQLVAGTTTFAATAPGAAPPVRPNYPDVITVNSPTTSFSLVQGVGAGLATQGTVFFSTAIPAGGSSVTLTSSDPTRALLAPNFTTAGAGQITIPLAQGVGGVSFVVMGLEDVTGNPTITAQTPGYTDATVSISVQPIGVQWNGSTSLTTIGGDGFGAVMLGIMAGVPGNRSVSPEQVIRFGGVARTVTLTSSNPGVVLPLVGGVAQQDITATINPGESRANAGVRPIGAGTATIGASAAGLLSSQTTAYPQPVIVTVPAQTLSIGSFSQGAGLSQPATLFLQSPVPAGGATLTLTSTDPGRLLLAPNGTTAGSSQLTVDLLASSSSLGFTVMGLEGVTGTAGVTATISGYRDTTFTFTIVQPAVMLDGPPATRAISQGDVPFQAHVGIAAGANVTEQAVRFGAPAPLTVTLVSSAPAIGTLVVNGVTAATQQVEIPIGAAVSSAAIDARPGFRPLASGNTTVTATIPGYQQVGNAIRTVTVSP